MYSMRVMCIVLAVFVIGGTLADNDNKPTVGGAYVQGSDGQVQGTVFFAQQSCNEPVQVFVNIWGLTPGEHGFHVHQTGDLSNGCTSLLGHFNPDGLEHGAPEDQIRHVGDLGNIIADANGFASATITDHLISLSGKNNIIGRGVVVHALRDDLGAGGHPDSKTTGNAGARVACGVIGIVA